MNARHLTLNKFSDDRWRVATSFGFTAHHWLLDLDFTDGQLSAMRIRTNDGPHDHPDEAPSDAVFATPLSPISVKP
jgi:hypothetical protein